MFSAAVQLHFPGWSRLRAVVGISRAVHAKQTGNLQPSIHLASRIPMLRGPARNGYAHFWARHTFTSPALVGSFFAEFTVIRPNGGYEERAQLFTIRPTGK
jgi:hypothetical protein